MSDLHRSTTDRIISRRGFLLSALAGGVVLGTVGASGGSHDTFNLDLSERKTRLRNLPTDLEGYRIAFLSDFHLGVFVPSDYVVEVFRKVSASRPDLVLLGGDYIGVPDSYPARLFTGRGDKEFGALKGIPLVKTLYSTLAKSTQHLSPPDGIYAVLGNHDNWNNGKLCVQEMESSKVKFLLNSYATVSRGRSQIELIGVDDYWTGVPRLPLNARARNPTAARIVISHNPDYLELVLTNKQLNADLALAGHTHGGQIRLPLLGAVGGYNVRSKVLTVGEHTINGCKIYVSRGLGVVDLPFRINCRPEATIFELTRA